MKRLQSQSKITPTQNGLCPQINAQVSASAGQAFPVLLPMPLRLTDRDFLLRWEPSRHNPAIKGLPSVTEADLQRELIHTVSHVCSPSLPPPYAYIQTHSDATKTFYFCISPHKTKHRHPLWWFNIPKLTSLQWNPCVFSWDNNKLPSSTLGWFKVATQGILLWGQLWEAGVPLDPCCFSTHEGLNKTNGGQASEQHAEAAHFQYERQRTCLAPH